MSLSVTLFNALSGLQTNQSALQVVSSNVANVNTPDYTRKVHEQQTRVLDGMAMGVETADVVRKVDEFLLQELVRETAVLGQSDVRAQFFERMQTLFGTPGSNSSIANAITALGTALEDVANSPDVGAVQLTAVIAAETAARTLQDLATGVQELRAEADRQIADAVATINDKLAAIAKLNGDIAHNEAQGLPTGDLKDQRDAAVRTVANFLAINQHEKSDGQIILLTKEGRNLVSGSNAAVLDYDAAGIMTATQTYPLNLSGIVINNGADIAGELSIGRLAGLIEMRDQTLPAMTAQLDQLAATDHHRQRGHFPGSGCQRTARDRPLHTRPGSHDGKRHRRGARRLSGFRARLRHRQPQCRSLGDQARGGLSPRHCRPGHRRWW
jgi:flagellar hook-associated protein 1 FlgK